MPTSRRPQSRRSKLLIALAVLLALSGIAAYFTLSAVAGPTEAERAEIRASVAGLGLAEARDFAAACLEAAGDEDEAAADAASARAVALFEDHIEAHPDDVDALLDLARVHLGCKIPFAGMMARGVIAAEAEELYARALDADPDSLRAHLDYGVLLYNLPRGPIRVVLVDDQVLFREGLRTLLSMHDDVQVVSEARDGGEALKTVRALDPDVVLMDLRMPGMDGVEATRRLVESGSRSRVVALTTFDDDDSVLHVLRAGAVGYLLKDVPSALRAREMGLA